MNTLSPTSPGRSFAAIDAETQAEARQIVRGFAQEPIGDAVHSAIADLLDEESRNKRRPLPLRSGEQRATVAPYDFPMECTFEYDPGEPRIFWPTERAHPGSPASCNLRACFVGGVDIMEMLNDKQIERIEELLLEDME